MSFRYLVNFRVENKTVIDVRTIGAIIHSPRALILVLFCAFASTRCYAAENDEPFNPLCMPDTGQCSYIQNFLSKCVAMEDTSAWRHASDLVESVQHYLIRARYQPDAIRWYTMPNLRTCDRASRLNNVAHMHALMLFNKCNVDDHTTANLKQYLEIVRVALDRLIASNQNVERTIAYKQYVLSPTHSLDEQMDALRMAIEYLCMHDVYGGFMWLLSDAMTWQEETGASSMDEFSVAHLLMKHAELYAPLVNTYFKRCPPSSPLVLS